jgi:putative ABC transport system permease protein
MPSARPDVSTLRRRLIAVVTPALDAFRTTRGTALLVVLLGATALAATVPVRSLGSTAPSGTSLTLPDTPPPAAAVRWTPEVRSVSATQAQALKSLFQLLEVLAWVTFAVAAVSLLTTFTVRASARGPDIRIRRSVGASRRGLFASLVFESGLLVAAIAAVGLLAAGVVVRAAVDRWPGPASFGLVPWMALGLTGLLVVLGGLLPLGTVAARDLAREHDGQVRLRFAALQLGLSLAILMAGSLLGDRTAVDLSPGAEPAARGVAFSIDSGIGDPAARAAGYRRLLTRLEASHRFDSVSLAAPGELAGLGTIDEMSTDCGECYSGMIMLRWHHLQAVHRFVSPDTFAAEGFRMERGRTFTAQDDWAGERVAVVNRYLAAKHFQRGEAIGRPLYLSDGFLIKPYRVIGIVDDRRSAALGGARQPLETVYLSVLQHPPAQAELVVRPRDGVPVQGTVRAVVAGTLGSTATIGPPTPVAALHRLAVAPLGWFGRGYALAGVLALIVATIGAFASLRLWVGSIEWELAVRRSVGAPRWRIAGYVLARGLGTGLGGIALGLFLFLSVLWGAVSDSVVGVAGWRWDLVLRLAGILVVAGLAGAALPLVRMLREPPARAL